jgi:hypothetical protein
MVFHIIFIYIILIKFVDISASLLKDLHSIFLLYLMMKILRKECNKSKKNLLRSSYNVRRINGNIRIFSFKTDTVTDLDISMAF